ncbi:MAG: hypothetical protein SCH66_14750 [Methanolobus sp.]|nr:hypothetical protein [Methanolobus sp.]
MPIILNQSLAVILEYLRKSMHMLILLSISDKEVNNIDEQALDVKKAQEFINEKAVYDFILNLTPEKAQELGIKHRSALAYLKKKAKEGDLNFKHRNLRRTMKVFGSK